MIEEIKSIQKMKITEKEEETLRGSLLFSGIRGEEIRTLLVCLKSRKVTYAKGEVIFRMGEKFTTAALLLSGKANIEWYDYL